MNLTQRERLLIVGLLAFITAWAAFRFLVRPAIARTRTLNRVVPDKQKQLEQLRIISKEYVDLKNSLSNFRAEITAQDENFELLPYLESLTEQQRLAENVATMKQQTLLLGSDYSETIVEVKLNNLTLNELIDFLSSTESTKKLTKIRTLHIKKNPTNQHLLDCTVEIRSPELGKSQFVAK